MFTFFWQAHRSSHSATREHSNVVPVPPPPFSPLYFPLLVIISLQKLRLLTATSASVQAGLQREQKFHSAPNRSQMGQPGAGGEAGSADGRPSALGSSVNQASGRKGSQRGQKTSPHSPAHTSDSAHSQHAHRGRSSRHQRK